MSTSFIILPNFLRPKATQRLLSAAIVSAMPFLPFASPLRLPSSRPSFPSPPPPLPPFHRLPFSRFFVLRATLWKRQPCSILNDRSSSQRLDALGNKRRTDYELSRWRVGRCLPSSLFFRRNIKANLSFSGNSSDPRARCSLFSSRMEICVMIYDEYEYTRYEYIEYFIRYSFRTRPSFLRIS